MSVINGHGDGAWSAFAMKAIEERDALRAKVEEMRKDNDRLSRHMQESWARVDELRSAAENLRKEAEQSDEKRIVATEQSSLRQRAEAEEVQNKLLIAEKEGRANDQKELRRLSSYIGGVIKERDAAQKELKKLGETHGRIERRLHGMVDVWSNVVARLCGIMEKNEILRKPLQEIVDESNEEANTLLERSQ